MASDSGDKAQRRRSGVRQLRRSQKVNVRAVGGRPVTEVHLPRRHYGSASVYSCGERYYGLGGTVVTVPPIEVMVRVVVVVAAYAGDAAKSTTQNRLRSPFPSIFLTPAAGETVAKSDTRFLSPLQLNT
jgi:hypothetical protein